MDARSARSVRARQLCRRAAGPFRASTCRQWSRAGSHPAHGCAGVSPRATDPLGPADPLPLVATWTCGDELHEHGRRLRLHDYCVDCTSSFHDRADSEGDHDVAKAKAHADAARAMEASAQPEPVYERRSCPTGPAGCPAIGVPSGG